MSGTIVGGSRGSCTEWENKSLCFHGGRILVGETGDNKLSDSPSWYSHHSADSPHSIYQWDEESWGWVGGRCGRARATLKYQLMADTAEEETSEQTSEGGEGTRPDRTGEDGLLQDKRRCSERWREKAEAVVVKPISDQLQICFLHDTRLNAFFGVKKIWMTLWTFVIIHFFSFLGVLAFFIRPWICVTISEHIPQESLEAP